MVSAPADYMALRLATDPVPPRDRAAVMREIFGRIILNLELEPDPDVALRVDFKLQSLSGLKIVTGTSRGVISRRTRALLGDSNDDLFLSLNESEVFSITHRGRSVDMQAGDAVLASCAEPVSFRRAHGRAIGLRIPRAAFAHMAPAVEDLTGRLIHHQNEPLQLLRRYVNSLEASDALSTPELRHLVVCHVHDLLALALDATGDARAQAAGRGLKAARLRAIKAHVTRGLGGGDLSVDAVAAAHHLTQRYVQRLFEEEGTTFSLFVSHQRLARAYRLLHDPRRAGQAVGVIAYECGFGDISHFNRTFRRLYDCSPSEVRQLGLGAAARDDHGR
jgi:AraC-like DNA-binding protein